MSRDEDGGEIIIALNLPAWMASRIVTALTAVGVELAQVKIAQGVYVSPSERRAFERELDLIAQIGRELHGQIQRQRPQGLTGVSAPGT